MARPRGTGGHRPVVSENVACGVGDVSGAGETDDPIVDEGRHASDVSVLPGTNLETVQRPAVQTLEMQDALASRHALGDHNRRDVLGATTECIE